MAWPLFRTEENKIFRSSYSLLHMSVVVVVGGGGGGGGG